MGAYLSEPIVDKESSDESNEFLNVGASSMQGWRKSQEDAHNCILNFDEFASFFAVYDGHGGAEVAAYCAEKLPEFLKKLEAYKSGDFEKALKDSFLGFDATLLEQPIIEILKNLAGERNPDQESDMGDEEEDEDLDELCQEGTLPLDKVLEKYKEAGKIPLINKLKESEPRAGGSGTNKPLSPFLRGRKPKELGGDDLPCSSSSQADEVAGSSSSATVAKADIDSTVSSSSSKEAEAAGIAKKATANGSAADNCSPDSSEVKESIQNGSVTSCKEAAKSEAVSSSSHVSSNGEAGATSSSKSVAASSASGISSSTSRKAASASASKSTGGVVVEDDTSSDSDADFHGDDNSSTEDGEECKASDDSDDDADEDDEEDDDDEQEDDEETFADDEFCANMIEEPGKDSGCTAVVALLYGRDLYVANAGDSRCVVCRDGKAIEMSFDHKPEDDIEMARIIKAGGRVTLDGRVNGGLNLSRALGDHAYKMNKDLPAEQQMISAQPDIRKLVITPADEFMVLACDGIWNFLSSEEVVALVKMQIDRGETKMSAICEQLFDHCLAPNTLGDGTGCDNMTAVIVNFKPKILELPSKLNFEEVEKEVQTFGATTAKADENEDGKAQPSALKRSASPTPDESEASESSNKRLKTDDDSTTTSSTSTTEAVSTAIECDSGSSSSATVKAAADMDTDSAENSAIPTTTT